MRERELRSDLDWKRHESRLVQALPFNLGTNPTANKSRSGQLHDTSSVNMATSLRIRQATLRGLQSSGSVSFIIHPSPTILRDPRRQFSTHSARSAPPGPSIFSLAGAQSPAPSSYFQRPSLPANTVVRFVPQQTAWIVERMGKFNRILKPGLAVLWPFLDRIAYVKSLKEAAIEIPSQSAITADNVTLELDGVLYTRVFDAYKARYVQPSQVPRKIPLMKRIATASKMPSMPFPSSPRQRCVQKLGSCRSITS